MAKFGEGSMRLGINKLFNEESKAMIRSTHTVQYIDIDKIEGHEKNRKYDPAKLEALALDIADLGLHTPIFVMPVDGDHYRVLSGHRRLEAFRLLVNQGKAEYQTIPAIIRNDLDEDRAEEILIGDNAFSEPLTSAELAKELGRKKELLQKRRDAGEKIPGKLTEIIASELGITAKTARELDTINRRAAPEIKELFEDGEISQREAYLASRQSEAEQIDLANRKKNGVKHLFSSGTGVAHTPPLKELDGDTGVAHTPPLEELDGDAGVVHEPPLEESIPAPFKYPSFRFTAQEMGIDYDDISYLCAFGTHINGGWIAILNFGVAAELSNSGCDVSYNTKKIEEALLRSDDPWLPTGDNLTSAARHIAEIVTERISE